MESTYKILSLIFWGEDCGEKLPSSKLKFYTLRKIIIWTKTSKQELPTLHSLLLIHFPIKKCKIYADHNIGNKNPNETKWRDKGDRQISYKYASISTLISLLKWFCVKRGGQLLIEWFDNGQP